MTDSPDLVAPRRRDRGSGAIYRKGDGWEGRINLPVDPARLYGPKKTHYRRARTKREVASKLRELRENPPNVAAMSTGNEKTVAEFAADWFASVDREGLRAKTAHDYKRQIERYVLPRIGPRQLTEITPETVKKLLDTLRLRGGSDGRPLGPHSIRLIRLSLLWMLGEAEDAGYTAPDLVERVKAAETRRKKRRGKGVGAAKKAAKLEKTPTVEQVHELLRIVLDTREIKARPNAVLVALAAFSGARRGELAAARYRDITVQPDGSGLWLITSSATVAGSEMVINDVKNGEPRQVLLDPTAMRAIDIARRERPFSEFLAQDPRRTTEDGSPLPVHPDALAAYYRTRAKEVEMPTGMHGMRRYVATRAVALNGGDAVAAAEALGHEVDVLIRHYLVNGDPDRVRATMRALAAELVVEAPAS